MKMLLLTMALLATSFTTSAFACENYSGDYKYSSGNSPLPPLPPIKKIDLKIRQNGCETLTYIQDGSQKTLTLDGKTVLRTTGLNYVIETIAKINDTTFTELNKVMYKLSGSQYYYKKVEIAFFPKSKNLQIIETIMDKDGDILNFVENIAKRVE